MNISRRQLLTNAGGAASAMAQKGARRPNVVLIMTDDQGYGDLHCHGNPVIETPNLDRLHSESVRFTNFHVDPLCAPTRSALLTGRYAARTGVWATIQGRSLLRADETTAANVFAENGYRTGIFGKWHLGDNYPFRPQDRGFREVLVHGGGGVGQTPDYWGNKYFDDTYFRNGKPEKFTGYCTDVFFDNAIRFVEQNSQRPFFLYLPTNAPHAPYRVSDREKQPYLAKSVSAEIAAFYGMIANIDDNIGRLRKRLSELKLEDNTILVWLTDNGSSVASRPDSPFSGGMRAAKGSPYEGGHRVPCFLRWPARSIGSGRDISQLAAHIDLLPTLIELAGLRHTPKLPLDGISLGPLIRGERVPDRSLVVQVQQRMEDGKWAMDQPKPWINSAVMTDRWRLVNGKELYDVQQDTQQKSDIASSNGEVVRELRNAYEKWWQSVSTRFSEYNEIILGSGEENPTTLNCMDWHGEKIPWDQTLIRSRLDANGFWAVKTARAGTYRVTLRQQPAVANFPIEAKSARLKIGSFDQTKPIEAGASAVSFTTPLPKSSTRIETWFDTGQGSPRGAYFVEVEYLGKAAKT